MKTAPTILIFLIALASCKQSAPVEDLNEVVALKAHVDSCLSGVQAMDMDAFNELSSAVKQEMEFMNRHNEDTLAQEEAIFLANYFRFIKKPMARILKGHTSMIRDLQKTSAQLQALHDDMKNGLVDKIQYKAELSTEKLFAEQQLQMGNEMLDDYKAILERYEQEHDKVVSYVAVHRKNTDNE
jgi:uncharacterized protein YaaN involved in tellurite resistance